MPQDRANGMIDGFSSVQALRRKESDSSKTDPATKPATESPYAPMGVGREQEQSAQGSPAHVGHTAMPTRHELVCYECSFSFTVTGRLDKVFCPKCRTELVTGSLTIEGEWSKDVKTVGRVEVRPRSTVTGATLIGTDIWIAGDVSEAVLKPTRRIELDSGAKLPPGALRNQSVLICEGAEVLFDEQVSCADIEIAGLLRADLRPTGTVTVKPGGCLRGSLQAEHLVVEEGGGLQAEIRVMRQPKREAAPEQPKPSAQAGAKQQTTPGVGAGNRPAAATKKATSGKQQQRPSHATATAKKPPSSKPQAGKTSQSGKTAKKSPTSKQPPDSASTETEAQSAPAQSAKRKVVASSSKGSRKRKRR